MPQKIAILGGGAGALSAAFGLTEAPDWRERYEITVYQQGWRLGGKGASGRNAAAGQRIEEHGLHVWAGFYENAFRVIRACYREMRRRPDEPLATWRDAFKPHSFITVEEQVQGRWVHWNVNLPTNPDLPGEGGSLPTLWEYIPRTLAWMSETFLKHHHEAAGPALGGAAARPPLPDWLDRLVGKAEADLGAAAGGASGLLYLQNAWKLARSLPADPVRHAPAHHQGILWLLEEFMRRVCQAVCDRLATDDTARRLWVLMDFGATHVRGLLADGVIYRGFDAIDDWEWSDWLRKHGVSDLTLQSPLVRGTYDYIFGFREGDTARPAVAAGTCVRGLLRLGFTARGAVFWEMQAGMGDTVFTPLYQVLKNRGVKFRFFHRVFNLGLSDDKKSVQTLRLGQQVHLKGADYDPLVPVRGLPCWPSEPRYEQIAEGDELRARGIDLESFWSPWQDVKVFNLEKGRDFDLVVLGISLGALKNICPELIQANERWREMVEKVQTVRTQAMQLWLKPDAVGLGWKYPPTIVTAYAEPLDTWADMSHLIPREDWPAGQVPASIAYFCGPLKDDDPPAPPNPTYPEKEKAGVKATAMAWLQQNAGHLWPKAAPTGNPQGLDWDLLADPSGGSGSARFDAQYWRANVNPSDRYVISLPGSTAARLRAGESGFDNLFLAGDWVRTGINAGCVEAAVMSGLQASRAICGSPADIPGETDRLPLAPLPPVVLPGWLRRKAEETREFFWRILQAVLGLWRPSLPARRRAQPGYVEVGGEQVFCHPLRLAGTRFYSFLLDADYAALRAVCDKYLNHPSPGGLEYHPLLPNVILGFADIGRAGCVEPPDSEKGWMREIDVAFWLPVVGVKRILGVPVVERLAWFLPYVFVNNTWASASGREIYGFPKETGDFKIPRDLGQPAYFEASTLVLERYSPNTEAQVKRIAQVRRTDAVNLEGPARPWGDFREGFEEFIRLLVGAAGKVDLPGLGLAVEIFKLLTHQEIPFIFLKQFRDVANGRLACYQSLVEAPARLLRLHSGGLLPGEYRAEVFPYDSHPILRELGLQGGEQRVGGAWYTEFDFIMERGREVPKGG